MRCLSPLKKFQKGTLNENHEYLENRVNDALVVNGKHC
jgi:hypothetical protein